MEKLKDFLYEQSDIFFTIAIVSVVIAVVSFNMYGWFDIDSPENNYTEVTETSQSDNKPQVNEDNAAAQLEDSSPSTDTKETEKPLTESADSESTTLDQAQPNTLVTENTSTEENKNPEDATKEESTTPSDIKNHAIEVSPGSASSTIANSLQNKGLIKSSEEFLTELIASGKETKLKAGTYTIPEGSTITEIINILTK